MTTTQKADDLWLHMTLSFDRCTLWLYPAASDQAEA